MVRICISRSYNCKCFCTKPLINARDCKIVDVGKVKSATFNSKNYEKVLNRSEKWHNHSKLTVDTDRNVSYVFVINISCNSCLGDLV